MSNDLLIDLDDFYRGPEVAAPGNGAHPPSNPVSQSFPFSSFTPTSQSQPQAQTAPTQDDDDDWGGFETAETPAPQAPITSSSYAPVVPVAPAGPAATTQAPFDPFAHQRQEQPPSSTHENSARIDYRPDDQQSCRLGILVKHLSGPQGFLAPSAAAGGTPKKKDPNVLFDVEDIDETEEFDDDEFGDFETSGAGSYTNNTAGSAAAPAFASPPRASKPTPPPAASEDLFSGADFFAPQPEPNKAAKKPGLILGNITTSVPSPYPPPLKSPPFQERNPYKGLAIAAPKQEDLKKTDDPNSPSPVTAWPDLDGGAPPASQRDEWAPWEDFPEEKPEQKQQPRDALRSAQGGLLEEGEEGYDDKEPPPTNIPPPSVLMTILPGLFNLATTSLFQPTAGQSAEAKKKIMSDPATLAFLRSYLLIATVAARILAGRKLRWHRDKFLAQGMAISAAGAKGMKLAGVDKAETAREDREAADVVAAWKTQVGRVRSAVAAANAATTGGGTGAPGSS
ncbi:unnamed protein product [Parascedosporium putredinis]|uniref:Uncharacterized protein n=1 Tax=Parascedosporium putredinis TaxID=1442378 RepID=A0A9P1GXP9_9PEZI|nr:unnamed protein product [Parascedosporium putredinis]CAI7989251.1 unnamed protein product [Parascedosporium putredinis]